MKKKFLISAVLLSAALYIPICAEAAPYQGWHLDSRGWWYVDEYGEYPADCVRYIHGSKYLFDENGYMLTGWHDVDDMTYYFDDSGAMADSGWELIDGDYYYFYDNGRYETTWVADGCYLGEDGKWVSSPGWVYNYQYDTWHYINNNGRVISEGWNIIDGNYYYFYDYGGVMAEGCTIDEYFVDDCGVWDTRPGWKAVDREYKKDWFYVGDNGYASCNKWELINGEYYYFYGDGTMAAHNVIEECYVNGSGVYDTNPGWKHNPETDEWFYVDDNYQAVQGGWIIIDGKEYYFNEWNGTMEKNVVVDGKYLGYSGAVDTNPGWKYYSDGETWFYVKEDGYAAFDGWEKINGKYYYFYAYGGMVRNYEADGFFVDDTGARDTTQGWKHVSSVDDNRWYYVDEYGRVVRDTWKKIDGKHYFFFGDGTMASEGVMDGWFLNKSGARDTTPGWKLVQYNENEVFCFNDWYYVDDNGYAVCDEWRQLGKYQYYFNRWGIMARDEYINGYYVDEDGIWRQ